ncbi:hypothetical protein CH47_4231 (plasmid) [Yersinia enterocolitica]|uniref:Uncharacterized protein n=1 Tax=Yersinia enterocolitica TaxID=630 RepID=Q84GR2_YEREN|nr:unknown [Yersinia enterocolitica]AJI81082.1 hypothetical protein CH47_4231 [Yersinia enterocolitica]CBW54745.1 p70 in pYVa127/90, part of insertion element [Yersinia enterocolitica (type O:8)]
MNEPALKPVLCPASGSLRFGSFRPTERLFFGDLIALWQYHSARHSRHHGPFARKPKHRHQPGAEKTGIPAARKGQRQDCWHLCIGHNFGWIQPGLLFQKAFQHKDRVPQRPRYNDAMKAGILIGHKVVPGDPSVITKVRPQKVNGTKVGVFTTPP